MHGGLNGIIHAWEDSRSHETQLAVTGQPLRVLVPSHLTGVRDPFDGLREAQFTSLRRHGVFRRVGRRAAIAWGNRRLFALTSLVAIVAIALRWATWWKPTHTLIIWSVSAGLAAILTITVVLLWQVFRSGPVTVMRIQGAIAAYLCLGFAWAHAYRIAELVDPGAFNTAGTDVSVAIHWINYSFGILTTMAIRALCPSTQLRIHFAPQKP